MSNATVMPMANPKHAAKNSTSVTTAPLQWGIALVDAASKRVALLPTVVRMFGADAPAKPPAIGTPPRDANALRKRVVPDMRPAHFSTAHNTTMLPMMSATCTSPSMSAAT